jgi:SAM-dependent methyltransferase
MKELLRKWTPDFIWRLYFRARLRKFKNLSAKEAFTKIYQEHHWGGEDSDYCSGDGTVNPNTDRYITFLNEFIAQHGVRSILDIGCGDFRIMRQVVEANPQLHFTGADVVDDLVERNNRQFGNERIRFVCLDAIEDELPAAQLCTVRQVLQHLSNDQIQQILKKLRQFDFVLVTEHLPTGKNAVKNKDKTLGPDIRLFYNSGVFLDAPPFSLPVERLLSYAEDFEVKGMPVSANMETVLYRPAKNIS